VSRSARPVGAERRHRTSAVMRDGLPERSEAARLAAADWRLSAALQHCNRPAETARSNFEWRSRGSCLQEDPELFFPHPGEDPSPAMAVCRRCAVVGMCLATALTMGEVEGVWGATTGEERRGMHPTWQALRA
jgi:Transcription factor WhiB